MMKRRFSMDASLSGAHLLQKRRGSVDSTLSDLSHRLTHWKKKSSASHEHLRDDVHYKKHNTLQEFRQRFSEWKNPQYVYVVVELNSGKKKILSGEDGSGIKETLAEAAMEHRISSYRLIMASTRAILNSTSTESAGSVLLDQALEDVFEESDIPEGICVPKDDNRFETVLEILKSEREFYNLLQSVLDIYAESFRKFSSLSKEDHKTLFFGVEPILSISAMLNTKLEDALNSWDTNNTQIGNLFSSKFWNHFDEYCKNYSKTRRLLDEKFSTDDSFVEFCNLRKGKSENSIESLLYLPVQRIPEYDKYLNDLLDETDSSHPDYDDLTRAATRVRNMVRDHEDELGTSETQVEMERIQKKFPNDDLQLGELHSHPSQTLRSLSNRRKSASGAVLFKTLGNKSKSTGNLLSTANMGKKELDNFHPNRSNINKNLDRHYVMEGAVEFALGVQTQDRYLFLFNDLLLIAKQKSNTTFKLKHRVRVCEIWLSTCIYDVSELTRPAEKSFVIGWPTTNVVATFKTVELKEEWLNKLNDQIEEEKAKEIVETVKIKVKNRELDKTCAVEVDNRMDANEMLKNCMNQFNFQTSDAKDYQIWVRSGKEESPYPLIGHELPYSIHQSHIRDIYAKTNEPMIPENFDKILLDAPSDMKVDFILKHSKRSPKKPSFDENSSKNSKKNKKSPLINFFRRHKDDKNNNNAPPGKLFGHPLSEVVEGGLPHSVLELMRILFREGPYTKGILRKSPNAKMCKDLRQRLDDGEDCITEDCPPLVIGALLKDYLRSLPQCLLIEDLYDDWLNLNEEEESPEKLQKVKQLLMKLPVYHFDLLRHLMCVLYHIEKKSEINMMTSYNLAVCIAPSILWSKIFGDPIKALATTNSPQAIVQYLIDNCGEVFGDESLYLFGAPVEQKIRQDSSTDSDSMHSVLSIPDSGSGSALRRDDSSIDSLEREFYPGDMDSSPNLAKSHLSPSNLSRDSGLTLSDTQLYDDDGSSVELLHERGKSYGRSVSHFYERDEKLRCYDNVSKSYDTGYSNYDISNPKPPPRKNRRKGSEQSDQSPDMEQYRHQTRYSSTNHSAMTQSYSTDALSRLDKYSSSESLKGLEERESDSGNLQDWRKTNSDFGTLVKSPSGAHLFFNEDSSRIVTEIDITGSSTPTRSNQKLVRQQSVTSTPPMSPESKYSQSSSSFESLLTDSSASYLSRQLSRDKSRSDNRSSWYVQEDQSIHDSLRQNKAQDNVSISNAYSRDNRNLIVQNMQYFPSSQNHQHSNLAVTRSFPMEYNTSPKGSGSSTAKEAEDIIDPTKVSVSVYDSSSRQRSSSPRYSNSPASENGSGSNLPLKQINKYTTGLGTSPPPKVLLQHMQQKSTPRRENTPLRASHDSAIVSQVRRSSFDCVEGDLWRRSPSDQYRSEYKVGKLNHHLQSTLTRSESDPDLNRTLNDSSDGRNRPDKPPSYDEALQRNFMMKHGFPLEISEQDSEKQKEVSAKARQLYEQSLRQYMQEHLASPPPTKMDSVKRLPQKEVIVEKEEEEEEESSEGEEIIITTKDPKKIYEESLKMYERKDNVSSPSKNIQSPSKRNTNRLSVPVCNLHRSASDSADHTDKLDRWRRQSPREHSPLAQDQTLQRGSSVDSDPYIQRLRESSPSSHREYSPNRSSLSHSSSSVSNSSSDTVIENTHNPPYHRERTDSSPTLGRHQFRTVNSTFLPQYQKSNVLQKDSDTSSIKSRDSSKDSVYSYRGRDSNSRNSDKASVLQSSSRKEEYRDNSNSVSNIDRRQISNSSSVSRNEPSYRRQLQSRDNVVNRENLTPVTENRKSIPVVSQSQQQKPTSASSHELPWSVKQLRNKFQGNSKQSDNSSISSSPSRPPPPPYQPPPPFRKASENAQSSKSSATDRSSKFHSAHKYGGPQARDSFSSSDDSDVSSRCSGHHRLDTSSSSDELGKWRYTDVSYV